MVRAGSCITLLSQAPESSELCVHVVLHIYIARLAVLRFTSVGSSLCQKQQPVKLGRRCIASGRVQFQLARDPPTSAELLSTAGFFLLQSCRVCAASFDFLSRRVDSGQSLNCTCTSWSAAAPVFPHELCKKSMYGSACIETARGDAAFIPCMQSRSIGFEKMSR